MPPFDCPRCGWCHPWAPGRAHSVPLVPGARERTVKMVRAEGVEPSRAVKLNGFSYRLRLSPPGCGALKRPRQVCGLDYPFTLSRKIRGLGAARLVSTPSRRKFPSGLGSGLPFQVSPNLGSSASPVSQTSTQVSFKSVASAVPPRPRGWSCRAIYHMGAAGCNVSLVVTVPDF